MPALKAHFYPGYCPTELNVLPHQLPGAGEAAGAPVFGGLKGHEAVQLTQLAQALVNHGPDAGDVAFQGIRYLAFAALGAAAGAVEELLGAAGHRAEAAG